LLWRIKEKVGKKKIRPRRAGVFPDGRAIFIVQENEPEKALVPLKITRPFLPLIKLGYNAGWII